MTKLKLFMGSNFRVLEDEINKWLEDNNYIGFKDIKWNIDRDDYHYAVIIYQIEK